MYEGMIAETVSFRGHKGDVSEAYYARPLGAGPWPAWFSFTTCRAGTNGSRRRPASSPTTVCDHLASPLFPRGPRQPR